MKTYPLLSDNAFKVLISNAPLISIDLILKDSENKVLLGYRNNPPAKGTWFVPGGRIMKDESLSNAFRRISFSEVGEQIDISNATFFRLAEHFYNDNKFEIAGLSTHYIVLVYMVPDFNFKIKETDQHARFDWFRIGDLIKSPDVHQNTKDYFL